MVKRKLYFPIILFLMFVCQYNYAQQLAQVDIEQCYEWATNNYPLIKQLDIIDKTKVYDLSNASKGTLPQININGQASYQSDVTGFPFSFPNVENPQLDKDQYKIYGDIYLPLSNRKAIKTQKEVIEMSAGIEKQQIDINLYHLKERVNQIFFGILLIEGKLKQLNIFQNDLNAAIEKTTAAIENGTAIESNSQLLNAELIKSNQRIVELEANLQAYISMLATLTNQPISTNTIFLKPASIEENTIINRPELQLFGMQNRGIDLQYKQIDNEFIPIIGLFAQVGYGRPALNFLSNDFEPYYIAGLRFGWNLFNFYTSKNKKQILQLSKIKLNYDKETFLLNTNLTMTQQSSEITKYRKLIETDNDLISIRRNIKETANVQLSNGLIPALDYISYVNAEDEANQALLLHQIQLSLAQYNLKITSGN